MADVVRTVVVAAVGVVCETAVNVGVMLTLVAPDELSLNMVMTVKGRPPNVEEEVVVEAAEAAVVVALLLTDAVEAPAGVKPSVGSPGNVKGPVGGGRRGTMAFARGMKPR
jgi:hypothetical protein